MRRVLIVLAATGVAFVGLLALLGSGVLGRLWSPAPPTDVRIPADVVASRGAAQAAASHAVQGPGSRQILFGDLHVHTTFSTDAFLMALPPAGGDGARPVNDACDFARFCSELDFWSINDHAEALTPRAWKETVEAIRQCAEVAGSGDSPDVVPFLGWEWTQMGTRPENHYGHKNVVLHGLGAGEVPGRPIAAKAPADAFDRDPDAAPSLLGLGFVPLLRPAGWSLDFVRYMRTMEMPECAAGLPASASPESPCREWVETPEELFRKLDAWNLDAIVIPHGTTWGFYTPVGSSWDKQLRGAQHDPQRQTLIEVFSGHGNSEEFRSWSEVAVAADGTRSCPEPRDDYLPSCWRAGEIIRERCRAAGEADAVCDERAAVARQRSVDLGLFGHLSVPGARPEDWLDAGQCRDCFQPAFNYRPRSSVQYIMALRDFALPGRPRRFEFGFMAASDNHSARPGTGYKEYARTEMTEARLTKAMIRLWGGRKPQAPAPESVEIDPRRERLPFHLLREAERATSFFLTGGLTAVHADGRSRDAIWQALRRREVYGTSGPRILLWFDLLNPEGSSGASVPMGGEARLARPPIFQARAVGSFEQLPGCPDFATGALSPERLQHLCRGECYNPSDRRRLVSRIEVVRIRPQVREGEPVEGLVEDPWRVFPCGLEPAGCVATFSDPDFVASGRDALYYVRAIEVPSPAVNADLVRCERDERGRCLSARPCNSDDPTDDCLAETEERAWSSPIFVEHAGETVARSRDGV